MDPLGIDGEPNPYVFLRSNPLSWIDTLGLTSYKGFPADKKQAIEEAVNKVKEKLVNSCCVDRPQKLLNKLENTTLIYKPKLQSGGRDLCGRVGPIDFLRGRLRIGPAAYEPGRCGALECTVLHELVHLRTISESAAYQAKRAASIAAQGVHLMVRGSLLVSCIASALAFSCASGGSKCPRAFISANGSVGEYQNDDDLQVRATLVIDTQREPQERQFEVDGGDFRVVLSFDTNAGTHGFRHKCSREPTALRLELTRYDSVLHHTTLTVPADFSRNTKGDLVAGAHVVFSLEPEGR